MSEFRNEPHTVVDDVPKCRTEYEEKCEYTQVLYCTVLYCTVLYCTALYCTIHPGRLRDGPEVQQVAQGGLLHRQGAQVQGKPRDQV